MKFWIVSGAGNRFAVLDLFRDARPDDAAALARRLCAEPPAVADLGRGARLDGLLLVGPSPRAGDALMELFNADGSRAETCGNGLRCTARLLCEWGRVEGDRLVIDTDAGAVEAFVPPAGSDESVRVCMGAVRLLDRALHLHVPGADAGQSELHELAGARFDMGNPHVVVTVDDVTAVPLERWGPRIERDERFKNGTNASFVATDDGQHRMRVWERGVGETEACGSAACAAAAWLVACGDGAWPVELELPGGRLVIDADERGDVWLAGPAVTLGTHEVDATIAGAAGGTSH